MRTFSKGKFFTERNLTNGLTHGAPFSGVHHLHLSHEPALLDSSVPYLSLIDPACAITSNSSNMVSTSSLAYSHMAPCKGCSCSISKTWDLSMHSLEVSHASSEMSSIHPSFSPRSGQACFYVTNAHGRAVLDLYRLNKSPTRRRSTPLYFIVAPNSEPAIQYDAAATGVHHFQVISCLNDHQRG